MNVITRLDINLPITGMILLKADGHEVYRGPMDDAIVDRWRYYFKFRTPWGVIQRLEQVWNESQS